MPPRSKRQKQAGPHMESVNERKNLRFQLRQKCLANWEEAAQTFDGWDLANPKGRSRTDHENKLVLLSVKMVLKMHITMIKSKQLDVYNLSWTYIEQFVATNMGLNAHYVRILRQNLFKDGDIITFGSSGNTNSPNNKDD
jgi:hypothetical protein